MLYSPWGWKVCPRGPKRHRKGLSTVPGGNGAGHSPGRSCSTTAGVLGSQCLPGTGSNSDCPSCSPLSRAGILEHVRGAGLRPWKSASGLLASTACPAQALSHLCGPGPPTDPLSSCLGTSMEPFRGLTTSPSGGHFLLLLHYALGQSALLCGCGVWLWRQQLAASAHITEGWIVDRGHRYTHEFWDSRHSANTVPPPHSGQLCMGHKVPVTVTKWTVSCRSWVEKSVRSAFARSWLCRVSRSPHLSGLLFQL